MSKLHIYNNSIQLGTSYKPFSDDCDNLYTLWAGLSRALSSISSSIES